jgi:hypothetical protein
MLDRAILTEMRMRGRKGSLGNMPPDLILSIKVDPQLSRKISQFRQKVVVSRNNQQAVILTFDLS